MDLLGIIKRLMLPPDIFFLIVLLSPLISSRWRKGGLAAIIFGFTGLYLTSLPVVGDLGLRLVSSMIYTPPASTKPQAIVILGGNFKQGDPPGVGDLTLERVQRGVALYHQTGLPILVSAGHVPPVTEPGADIMKTLLEDDLKIPVKWVEDRSRTTWQNAEYSSGILKSAGIHSVYLVTNRWHLPRAQRSFLAFGIDPVPVPAAPAEPQPFRVEDFIPSIGGVRECYYAAHELIGMLWYAAVH